MKSVVMKSIYAGLGLLGSGKETVEQIGRKIARRANLSEKDGEKIARELRGRSERAIASLQKTLDKEVNKVVKALHSATGQHMARAARNTRPQSRGKSAPRGK